MDEKKPDPKPLIIPLSGIARGVGSSKGSPNAPVEPPLPPKQ